MHSLISVVHEVKVRQTLECVAIDKLMMTPVTLSNVKCSLSVINHCTLFAGQTIQIRNTGPGISYLLRLLIFVYRYCWNLALSEREVYDWEVNVISFVVQCGIQ